MKRQLLQFSLLILLSISNTIQSQTEELAIVEHYILKSKELSQKNIDSSFFYIEDALRLSRELKNDSLVVKSNIQYSSLYLFTKKFDSADSILQINLKNDKIPLHLKGQTWHNLASIAYQKQNFEKALELYIKVAVTTEKSGNKKLLVNTYTNIGVINAQLQNTANAQKYLEKAVALADNNEALMLQLLVNLSSIYKQQQLLNKFEISIFKAEKLANKYNSKRTLSAIYNNLSDYYTSNKTNFEKAVFYGKKAVALKKELKHSNNLSLPFNNLGYAHLKNKEYKTAIQYLDSALPNAKGLLKSYVYNNLKNAYLGVNNYQKAMYFADLKDAIKDSLNNAQQKEKVADITEKYESEKKEQKIKLLNAKSELQSGKIENQRNLLVGMILGILMIAALVLLWFKNQKITQSLQQASLQHKLLQTQLNPHFLFHSLNNIQSFIYLNKKEESLNYLGSYSKLMRSIFDHSSVNFITVKEDTESMQAYLELQRVNFENNTIFSIHTDSDISEYLIPPMFVQPYIENAIQHGIKNIENGKVSVNYYNKEDSIEVSIFDNGKGIQPKNNNRLLSKESSTSVIMQRIKNLEKTHNYKVIQLATSDVNGTTIRLIFPKKLHI